MAKKYKKVGKPHNTMNKAVSGALKVKKKGRDWKIRKVQITQFQVLSRNSSKLKK